MGLSAKKEVELICGVVRDGELHKDVVLRPLPIEADIDIGDERLQEDMSLLTERVLSASVETIGGRPVGAGILDKLAGPDADWLIMHISDLKEVEVVRECSRGSCGEMPSAKIDVTNLDVTPWEREPDDKGRFTFEVENPELGLRATLRLPTRGDQKAVAKQMKGSSNPFKFAHTLCALCTVKLEGLDEVGTLDAPIATSQYLALPRAVGKWIRSELFAAAPGPDLSFSLTCPSRKCNRVTKSSLTAADFLLAGVLQD